MIRANPSEKKQKLIDEKNASPFSLNENVGVKEKTLNALVSYRRSSDDENNLVFVTIVEIDDNNKKLTVTESYSNNKYEINFWDVVSRDVVDVGAYPFSDDIDRVRSVAFDLDSILSNLAILGEKSFKFDINGIVIQELNWNPFVIINGYLYLKHFYQRDFCWSLSDKQNLIDSIYNNVDCGKILIRKRSWNYLYEREKLGDKELFFNDLVDGKQRLNTIKEFILNMFPDSNGNYFSDLSYRAQIHFTNNQLLSYAEMSESTTDEDVLRQFLKLNFTGVPQSKEQLEHVKSLYNKIQ